MNSSRILSKKLLEAISAGDAQNCAALIKQGAEVNPSLLGESRDDDLPDYPLPLAAFHNQLEIVRLLLTAGAEVDRCFDFPALYFAADHGNVDMLKTLIANGADVNWCDGEGVPLIFSVATTKHVDAIDVLVKAGALVNTWYGKESPLSTALIVGQSEMFSYLYKLSDDERRGHATSITMSMPIRKHEFKPE